MSYLSQQRLRQMLEDFILTYRNEPCLWQVKNRDYYNRTKRNAALDRLLEKYREAEPTAERDDVTRKINSLRTTYKKEKRKVEEAEQAGSVRVPKLWCYGLMAFIDGQDGQDGGAGAARQRRDDADDEEHVEEVHLKEEYEEADGNEVTIESTRLSIEHSDNEDPIMTIGTPRTKKRKVEYEYANDTVQFEDDRDHSNRSREDALHSADEHSHRTRDDGKEDRHDIFCKYITCKLRDLPKQQRLLAEKLINDVLFEAEWGNLTLKHKLAK